MATDTLHCLSEFIIQGRTYFIDHKTDRERIEIVFLDDKMVCWRGGAALAALRPEGFQTTALLELLRKALRCQDVSGERFMYELKQTGSTLNFTIHFKVKTAGSGVDSNIFLKGAEIALAKIEKQQEHLTAFLRRQAIASDAAATAASNLHDLEVERDRYKRMVEESVALRAAMEDGLLKSFVKVLNEKKRRLRELQTEVEELLQEKDMLQADVSEKDEKIDDLANQLATAKDEVEKLRRRLAHGEIGTVKEEEEDGADAAVRPLVRGRSKTDPPAHGTGHQPVEAKNSNDSYPDFGRVDAMIERKGSRSLPRRTPTPVDAGPPTPDHIVRELSDVSRTSGGSRKARSRSKQGRKKRKGMNGEVTVDDLLGSDDSG